MGNVTFDCCKHPSGEESPWSAAGLLLEQAQRAAAGVAQQSGQLCDEGPLCQDHQGALSLPLPGLIFLQLRL